MLSLYEILKASKTGIAPDAWTALAGKNWGGADSGHEVKELTGIPPLSFTADGTPLLDYLISGNMSQTDTPTQQNPIMPQGTGDLETSGTKAGQYKIPISSANTTTPVYLGEVQTTRRVKKMVLTGNETVAGSAVTGGWIITNLSDSINNTTGMQTSYCSHYLSKNNGAMSSLSQGEMCINTQVNNRINFVTTFATAENFKSYLAQQYAAGTPVTVWYVLATETTGIVNEPIRKIGDYADTLSMEQAGVQIPTNRGNTIIDVETTLKPSQMYIKYQE